MGRTVVYEDNVQEAINCLLRQKSYQHGFLIGQSILQRDYVIHLTQTPGREEPTADIEEEGKESPGSSPVKKQKSRIESLKDMDEDWICHHAKQVTRMLPGGMDVLGLFVIAPTDAFTSGQTVLKQILNSTFRSLSKEQKYVVCSENTEKVLLHICSITQKTTCKTFDIADNRVTLKPADWKLHSGMLRWHRMDCQFSLNMKVPLSKDRSKRTLMKQIQVSLCPLFCSISVGMTLLNRQLRDGEELLDAASERRKGRSKESASTQSYNVDLLLPMSLNNNNKEPQVEVAQCGASMAFLGTIHARAFVHQKATVEEAAKAIKQDIIRSITARCEIHCEDLLLIEEEQQDPTIVHKLPKRVFAPLMSTGITVCDYLFHENSASESVEAFRELLDLTISEDDIEVDREQLPPTHELIETDSTEETACSVIPEESSGRGFFIPIVGAAVAAMIAGLSYLFLQRQ